MNHVTVVNNTLLQDPLHYLRDNHTSYEMFRYHSDRLCSLLLSYAFEHIAMHDREIETPLAVTKSKKVDAGVVFLPILRAGVSMLFEALRLIPSARVGFAGLARDEETAIAHEYYWKIPKIDTQDTVFILDPMLATGGSIVHVLEKLHSSNITNVSIVAVIASPEGISKIHNTFSDIEIIVAAVDESLNDKKYIVPGLGDYGDRYFGTE